MVIFLWFIDKALDNSLNHLHVIVGTPGDNFGRNSSSREAFDEHLKKIVFSTGRKFFELFLKIVLCFQDMFISVRPCSIIKKPRSEF